MIFPQSGRLRRTTAETAEMRRRSAAQHRRRRSHFSYRNCDCGGCKNATLRSAAEQHDDCGSERQSPPHSGTPAEGTFTMTTDRTAKTATRRRRRRGGTRSGTRASRPDGRGGSPPHRRGKPVHMGCRRGMQGDRGRGVRGTGRGLYRRRPCQRQGARLRRRAKPSGSRCGRDRRAPPPRQRASPPRRAGRPGAETGGDPKQPRRGRGRVCRRVTRRGAGVSGKRARGRAADQPTYGHP